MSPTIGLLVYLFVGRVFVFIARDGLARRRMGQIAVAVLWPLLLLVMFGAVVLEMIQTGGNGYPDEHREPPTRS